MKPLLQLRDIEASYGHAKALFGVSLDVARGEVVTLLGRNGVGRSTTVNCLFGLLPITGGAIEVDGKSVREHPPYAIARRGLGLVPEGRQIFPNLTVEENLIATARGASGRDAKSNPWTLQRVYAFFPRLKERRANLGSQLSGGEQQMLAIGRALMTNPRLLVLDEATEGLAPLVRAEIWRALQELKDQGMAQIVIDKNVRDLATFADRHYVLEKGHVVWSGTSADLARDQQRIDEYMSL
ncbi:MAG TPA: ABC transporter ATP-binding protein [Ramlibacter sp.]|nr:ABC transporter ATP-binding protein [Ramlibacter sp.]